MAVSLIVIMGKSSWITKIVNQILHLISPWVYEQSFTYQIPPLQILAKGLSFAGYLFVYI